MTTEAQQLEQAEILRTLAAKLRRRERVRYLSNAAYEVVASAVLAGAEALRQQQAERSSPSGLAAFEAGWDARQARSAESDWCGAGSPRLEQRAQDVATFAALLSGEKET